MKFAEKVKNIISKLRAAGKTEKEVSEIVKKAGRKEKWKKKRK